MHKKNIPANDIVLKKKYGKNIGFFDGTTPNLYTTDVELIKSVFVKDIDHFMNKRVWLQSSLLYYLSLKKIILYK